MEFFDVIKKRHCCRKFDTGRIVDKDLINKIIEAGKMAPSACAIYPIEFTVITDPEIKKVLTKFDFVAEAPFVIVVWADLSKSDNRYPGRWESLFVIQDGAAAIENMFLATVALGLGTCWVGAFDEKNVKDILGLKKHQMPQAILPIGRPAKSGAYRH